METGLDTRFYLTRPEIAAMNTISDHIISDIKRGTLRNYHIIFVPRKMTSCEYILEKMGTYGHVTMWDWNLHLIPLDKHLLSLEYPNTARTLYFDGNYSVLHSVAQSILALEEQFGTIPNIYGKGDFAKMVWELVGRMKEALGRADESHRVSTITDLILFERSCDWVTPMCSQLTYEGMLDDVFNIRSGFVELGSEITGKSQNVKVLLNEKDPVFSLIRSMHFSAVTNTLIQVSKELQEHYSRGKDRSQSIQQIKEFVKLLPALKEKHQSLSMHLKSSEKIIAEKKERDFQRQLTMEWSVLDGTEKQVIYDFIDECIESQYSHYKPLQLLCLVSAAGNGIKSKYYLPFKRSFLHSYGHKHLVTFHNLAKVGLLKEKEDQAKSSFNQLSHKLQLVPKDPSSYDLTKPVDASYVFGGAYIPMSCAVIEHVVKRGNWRVLEETAKNWEGATFSFEQPVSQRTKKVNRVVLVFFIGGCTFSEISALHFMGTQLNCQFIVATTDIINCRRTLDSFMEMELS